MPKPVHQVVHCSELRPGRVVVLGDVHGCADELRDLLAKCQYDEGVDTLITVGDLVNKGPKSTEVLDLVRQLGALVVRGNHDEAAVTAFNKMQRGEEVKKKFQWVPAMSQEHLAYLHGLPFSLLLPELRVLVVHAGLVPGTSLEQQSLKDMFKMRDVVPASQAGADAASDCSAGGWLASEEAVEGGRPWAGEWRGPWHVFFGHDAKRKLQLHAYATGLDTGCVYGNQLTACVLPPVQIMLEAVRTHCPAGSPPPTLEVLGGRIVTVPARETYSKKKTPPGAPLAAEPSGEGEGGVAEDDDPSVPAGAAGAGGKGQGKEVGKKEKKAGKGAREKDKGKKGKKKDKG